jgi:hypothetical protein
MRNPWKLTSFALAACLAASLTRGVSAEPQPLMRDALSDLRAAATKLEHATQDKGGHRAKALELTRAAIVQVEQGIKFDNRH